jgi:hypothetical protein
VLLYPAYQCKKKSVHAGNRTRYISSLVVVRPRPLPFVGGLGFSVYKYFLLMGLSALPVRFKTWDRVQNLGHGVKMEGGRQEAADAVTVRSCHRETAASRGPTDKGDIRALELMAEGKSLREACHRAGTGKSNFQRWGAGRGVHD